MQALQLLLDRLNTGNIPVSSDMLIAAQKGKVTNVRIGGTSIHPADIKVGMPTLT